MSLKIYGNRTLKTLPGQLTRPTLARVRAAVFNIWQGTIPECAWLDLCAGTGAMGAEALARGARQVVGIEQSRQACAVIQQNWAKLATETQQIQILRGDIRQKLATLAGQQFDRIYFDPPYASDLYDPVLLAIAEGHLLAPGGELAVEHDPTQQPQTWTAVVTEQLSECRHKRYGNTHLTFLQVPD